MPQNVAAVIDDWIVVRVKKWALSFLNLVLDLIGE
jgi:hypothetical protein